MLSTLGYLKVPQLTHMAKLEMEIGDLILDPIFEAMDLTLSDDVLGACDKVHEEILYPMG